MSGGIVRVDGDFDRREFELHLETKSVIVSTGARPINPFGL